MEPSDSALSAADVTRLLQSWNAGDDEALARLTPVIDHELRRLAHRQMSNEREDHTLQTTALINEAYVRLMGSEKIHWESRKHFFAVAARMMRQILIDIARGRDARKRGDGARHLPLDEVVVVSTSGTDLIELDEALNNLAKLNARLAQVVELKFFGGLEHAEIADLLGVSEPTVRRDWRIARAWLYEALST
jgi:RNA polymerase sigma factor (TIGR02999 family)